MGDSHHSCASNKSAETMWCHHVYNHLPSLLCGRTPPPLSFWVAALLLWVGRLQLPTTSVFTWLTAVTTSRCSNNDPALVVYWKTEKSSVQHTGTTVQPLANCLKEDNVINEASKDTLCNVHHQLWEEIHWALFFSHVAYSCSIFHTKPVPMVAVPITMTLLPLLELYC